ncbi:MAG TPA: hypothetical protein VFE24_16270 [Pirellulales bacterium]|jgi:hypothetical protein|nr:hypothetical protein [Pirellulales bacterium]
MTEQEFDPPPQSLTRWVSLALWIWGGILAAGSYFMYTRQEVHVYDIRRPLTVLGCVALFQLFWYLLLRHRRAVLAQQAADDDEPNYPADPAEEHAEDESI